MAEKAAKRASETNRLVFLAIFSALALVAGLVESYFPLPVPGMRLGIANIFSLLALIVFGPAEALAVTGLKLLLAFFLTGNFFALACSLGGSLCSLPAAILLYTKCSGSLSVPAISVASAFAFNFGQVAAVVAMTGEPAIFLYLPVLLAFGALTGFAVGVLAARLRERIVSFL